MIDAKILYNNKNNQTVGLRVRGHARGDDLVCAAVSAVVTGGLNAIHDDAKFETKVKSGYVKIVPLPHQKISTYDSTVLKTIATQLETIAEAHPEQVTINYDLYE